MVLFGIWICYHKYTDVRHCNVLVSYIMDYIKWLTFCRGHFQMYLHLLKFISEGPIDQFHKSHNPPVPYPTMLHSEQKCAHFCSECGTLWDMEQVHSGICELCRLIIITLHWCCCWLCKQYVPNNYWNQWWLISLINDPCLVLQLSLPNSFRLGVKSRIKMWLEQRRQAMLRLHLSDHEFNCLLRCDLY